MVSLVISSITIAFAIAAFFVISKLNNSFIDNSEINYSKNKALATLNNDIFRASYLVTTRDGFDCISESIFIEYKLTNSFLTRLPLGGKLDTLDYQLEMLNTYLIGGPTEIDQIIDFIEFQASEGYNSINISKEVAADLLISEKGM